MKRRRRIRRCVRRSSCSLVCVLAAAVLLCAVRIESVSAVPTRSAAVALRFPGAETKTNDATHTALALYKAAAHDERVLTRFVDAFETAQLATRDPVSSALSTRSNASRSDADSEDDEDACAMEFKGFVMDALTAVVGEDAAPHVDNVYAEAVRESLEMRMRLGMDVPRLSANTRMAEHEVRNGRARVEDDAKGDACCVAVVSGVGGARGDDNDDANGGGKYLVWNADDAMRALAMKLEDDSEREEEEDGSGMEKWSQRVGGDVVMATASSSSVASAVLYAPLGMNGCRREFHQGLAELVHRGLLREYIWRPTVIESCVRIDDTKEDVDGEGTATRRRLTCAFAGSGDHEVFVSGYGVSMDIKNMEYKAIDEDASRSSTTEADGREGETTVNSETAATGDAMPHLFTLYPSVLESLQSVDSQLMMRKAMTNSTSNLVVEQPRPLDSIGIRAAQRLVSAASMESLRASEAAHATSRTKLAMLHLLEEMSHNFPNYASKILGDDADRQDEDDDDKEVRARIDALQERIVPDGVNILAVNGRLLNNNNNNDVEGNNNMVDVFGIVDFVNEEMRRFSAIEELLGNFSVTANDARRRLASALVRLPFGTMTGRAIGGGPGGGGSVRIDLRSDVAPSVPSAKSKKNGNAQEQPRRRAYVDNDVFHFLNDIERDRKYREWSPSVKSLLSPMSAFSRLPKVRVNIVTAIVVIDGGRTGALAAAAKNLAAAIRAYDGNLPVRFGLVLVNSNRDLFEDRTNDTSDISWDASGATERACRAFALIKEVYGSFAAIDFFAKATAALVDGVMHTVAKDDDDDVDEILFSVMQETIDTSKAIRRKADGKAKKDEDAVPLTVDSAKAMLIDNNAHAHFVRTSTRTLMEAGVLSPRPDDSMRIDAMPGDTTIDDDAALMVLNGAVLRESDAQRGIGLIDIAGFSLQQSIQKLMRDLHFGKLKVDDKNYIIDPATKNAGRGGTKAGTKDSKKVKFDAAAYFLRGAYRRYNPLILNRVNAGDSDDTETDVDAVELFRSSLGDEGEHFMRQSIKYFTSQSKSKAGNANESTGDNDDDDDDDDDNDDDEDNFGAVESAASITHWALCPIANRRGRAWLVDALTGATSAGSVSRIAVLPFIDDDETEVELDLVSTLIVLMTSISDYGTSSSEGGNERELQLLVRLLSMERIRGAWLQPPRDCGRTVVDTASVVTKDGLSVALRDVAAQGEENDIGDVITNVLHLIDDEVSAHAAARRILRQNRAFVSNLVHGVSSGKSGGGGGAMLLSPSLVTNGQVYTAVGVHHLSRLDIQLATSVEETRGATSLRDRLVSGLQVLFRGKSSGAKNVIAPRRVSDATMMMASLLSSRFRFANLVTDGHAAVSEFDQVNEALESIGSGTRVARSPKTQGNAVTIDWVIDPLSKDAQRIAPLFRFLAETLPPRALAVNIHMNPKRRYEDMPLRSYYSLALPSPPSAALESSFATPAAAAAAPAARRRPTAIAALFPRLPVGVTLTLHMDVGESWLVEGVHAEHDLDNIILADDAGSRTSASSAAAVPALGAIFHLTSLIATGSCFENGRKPPRGLQLHLGSPAVPHIVDTLVMANLGYFQLKALPGSWNIGIAPRTRSDEIYEVTQPVRVLVDSYSGSSVYMDVRKRPGMEREDIIEDDEAFSTPNSALASDVGAAADATDAGQKKITHGEAGSGDGTADGGDGLFGKITNALFGKKHSTGEGAADDDVSSVSDPVGSVNAPLASSGDKDTVVHIFSVASGHLYERFIRIMILSVLDHTPGRVKFWFIKNYLSPMFLSVIPEMASEFGFEYELITYKWPSWLMKQTDKIRTIWAYKILFLDVLFPQELDKVIFVDADQIVRANMRELMEMDLGGAPYAYTPFCDNNKDMDGYRFWRQGFWKDHLRGLPYHISALYVVDLRRFRAMAAGDKLRVIYDQLSRDKNSLSNLDQDLPNYAQHQVPIFSLPSRWLWCESWCGTETKDDAKTIDLCNNPMTKEPKLIGARRIVPEWDRLDARQQRVVDRVMSQTVIRKRATIEQVSDTASSTMPDSDSSSSDITTEDSASDDEL